MAHHVGCGGPHDRIYACDEEVLAVVWVDHRLPADEVLTVGGTEDVGFASRHRCWLEVAWVLRRGGHRDRPPPVDRLMDTGAVGPGVRLAAEVHARVDGIRSATALDTSGRKPLVVLQRHPAPAGRDPPRDLA